MKVSPLKYVNRNTCLALVVLVTLAICVQQLILESQRSLSDNSISFYNNYIIFKQSFYHLVAQKDIYRLYPQEHWDYYKYSPAFAVLFSVFAVLPDWLGLSVWNLLNVLVFFFALWSFPFPDKKKTLLAFAFGFIELTTNTHSAQSNGLIAGLLLLAFLLFEERNFLIGTLLIALCVYIKLFGLVAFLLILLYPERWKASLYAFVWLIVLAILPLIVVPFTQLVFLYKSWLNLLLNDKAVSDGFSIIGWLRSWFHIDAGAWVVPVGAILLCVPLIRFKLFERKPFRILMLASVLIWVVNFNHKAESPTFIIAVAGVALWFFSKEKTSVTDKALLAATFVLTILSPTDLFPKALRDSVILPYSLKVFPCIIVWGKIQYELLTRKYEVL